MEIIKGDNLTYEYTSYDEESDSEVLFRALDNVNISVKKGDFIAILGHNGSGKSTLAKHINALLTPTGGSLFINSLDTKNPENTWEIRKSAGMVFQNPDNQIIATIVEEDVAFGPENLGVPREEMITRIDNALKSVGMLDFKKDQPHSLSGGQKQRIGIAGILSMQPECIVLDEPTAMLDPSGRKDVMKTILQLNKENKITIVLITHFMEEAVLADSVFVMENGKIVMNDIPKNIFCKVDELKKLGLDVPQVTEIAFELNKNGIKIPENITSIEEMVGAIKCLLK